MRVYADVSAVCKHAIFCIYVYLWWVYVYQMHRIVGALMLIFQGCEPVITHFGGYNYNSGSGKFEKEKNTDY